MSDPTRTTPMRCAYCDAENPAGEQPCWLCHQPMEVSRPPAPATLTHVAARTAAAAWTFHLSSLMITIAVIAVFLGILVDAPGVAVLLLILTTPALIRTWIAASRQRAKGSPMTTVERLWAFAGSFGIVAVTGVAATGAFATICFGSLFVVPARSASGYGGLYVALYVGFPLGLIVAIYVFYRFVRWLWPVKG